ncbi:putative transcription factor bHLH041 isoform X1 [Cucumis melo var. makuwa]|uniref:Transcription factor bHLH041 isoform X1 n=2 Tax=Cucumis melo TaxID=3656 RepID=A0A5A7V2J9_CUCMM|nr:putative transcription factor bHLH041 isoform X1 [Cucumis melo var. makuwa]
MNLHGLFREDEDDDQKKQPSSSLGSCQRRLFNDYTQLIFNLENNLSLVPGHAFKNNISFLEVQESVLLTHSSSQIQTQFYAVSSVVFMGSSNGEIELGFSQVKMVEEMKQTNGILFPAWDEVSSIIMASSSKLPPNIQSSLSPKSPSIEETPEIPSLLFYNDLSTIPLLPLPPGSSLSGGSRGSAFEEYNVKKPAVEVAMADENRKRESLMKKGLVFYRKFKKRRIEERIIIEAAKRPASAQLIHMIAERRRREKLNESFLALRSILPPQTKKDKASVLATTREYLTKLKAQVSELSHRNHILLQAQDLHIATHHQSTTPTSSLNEPFTVKVSYAPPSPGSTDEIVIDLEIIVRGDMGPLMTDIAIRVLQFLKTIVNVRVVLSFHANHTTSPSPLTRLGFRFSLQGGEWDESAFLEAVRRIVSDLLHVGTHISYSWATLLHHAPS